jgi:hypothetical protein
MEQKMSVKNGSKLLAKVVGVAGIAVGIAIAFQSGASASPAPHAQSVATTAAITVTPATGLADGATVAVSGDGLTAGSVYHVGECAAVSATEFACDHASNKDVTATANGTLSTNIVVDRTFTGVTEAGASHAIDCKADSCVLAAFSTTDGGAVPLSFA